MRHHTADPAQRAADIASHYASRDNWYEDWLDIYDQTLKEEMADDCKLDPDTNPGVAGKEE